MEEEIRFTLNGGARILTVDGERPLLWVLRGDLGLTGTKYGCGTGLCGSCTVHVDGRAVRSCLTPVKHVRGRKVVTIEGLAAGRELHPVQQAFVDHDALQCGFCTPGMIMRAAAFLDSNPDPSREDIVAALDANLCRCGAHLRILEAVEASAAGMKRGGPGEENS